MTLLYVDSCDNGLIKFKGPSSNAFSNTTQSITGGRSISIISNAANFTNYAFIVQFKKSENIVSETYPQIRCSFWMKTTGNVTAISPFLRFSQTGSVVSHYLRITTSGYLQITDSTTTYSDATTGRATTTKRVDDGEWHHIEIYIKTANDSNGKITIRVDGVLEGSYTGDNYGYLITDFPEYIDTLRFSNIRGQDLFIDDIFIWDDYSTGDDWTNEKGILKILTIRPSADTSWANSTPSNGSDRYKMLNQEIANTSNTITIARNKTELYEFSDISENIGSDGSGNQIFAIVSTIVSRADTPGQISNIRMILANTTNTFAYTNTTSYIGSSYQVNSEKFMFNPIDNVTWTANAINNIKFGFES